MSVEWVQLNHVEGPRVAKDISRMIKLIKELKEGDNDLHECARDRDGQHKLWSW